MAGHFVAPAVTAGPTPQIHAGLNSHVTQYTLAETASGSTTIAIAALPGGARVVNVDLQIDNDDFDSTGGANVAVQAWIGGSLVATYIQSASGSLQVSRWNPAAGSIGLRLTASANLVVQISDAQGTGTASTVITSSVQYSSSEDAD